MLEALHFLRLPIMLYGYLFSKKKKCYMDISILQILLYMLYKLFFTNYKNNSITYLLFYCNVTNYIYCHINL